MCKLHEVCINHRLAVYIEHHLPDELNDYYVDIEYNRYNLDRKYVSLGNEEFEARPDIIIHRRMNPRNKPIPHYLIIEAKKENINEKDLRTVRGFLTDPKYKYGMTISYCSNNDNFVGHIYMFNGGINQIEYVYPKKK